MSRSRDLGDVGSKANFLDNVSTDLGDFSGQSIPHIIPDILYPAVEGKDLAGITFSGSYVYGTAHTDGRKYYYTDIKGSKPIRDPRIGGHFGSQRHKFKSLQLLDQETATHGEDVFSIDGREWCRIYGVPNSIVTNGNWGNFLELSTAFTLEITGYFNNFNLIVGTWTNRFDDIDITINGGTTREGHTTILGRASAGNPLYGRYVDAGSVLPISDGSTTGNNLISDLGTTPKIQTIKIVATNITSEYGGLYGCELIAQDTTSTANRSKIQIPSQNVVSYGKKFTVSGTPHYDPFTTMSYGGSGTTLSALQSLIDTDTSLGMDAWKAGTSNYHRPWNGGRIIKWVDSSGTIKTSVNMMPPNAQNIGTTASNAVSDAHVIAGTNDDTINFNTSAIDHTQAEVAKTFNWREFGNGNANAGPVTGSTGGSFKDFSMLYEFTATDCAFVMDDGLTSLSAEDVHIDTKDVHGDADGDGFYFTFIGTGITLMNKESSAGTDHLVQNLPYGSHIVKYFRSSGADPTLLVDGVTITCATGTYTSLNEITIHQPKMPPVPVEDGAVILADYMLMADFVVKTGVGPEYTSKGVLRKDVSRDVFYDGSSATLSFNNSGGSSGFWIETGDSSGGTAADRHATLPSFGTNFSATGYNFQSRMDLDLNGSTATYTNVNTGSGHGTFAHLTNNTTLGVNKFKVKNKANSRLSFAHFEVATPIHTSFHYTDGNKTNPKTGFETPFLNELVGGDRNLEQHTLICTPDGRSWDQLTRNTSYLGNLLLTASHDSSHSSASTVNIFDEWRGEAQTGASVRYNFNKDFAIAYDRIITLKSGQYTIAIRGHTGSGSQVNLSRIYVNGVQVSNYDHTRSTYNQVILNLVRGDYIQIFGYTNNDLDLNYIQIVKV